MWSLVSQDLVKTAKHEGAPVEIRHFTEANIGGNTKFYLKDLIHFPYRRGGSFPSAIKPSTVTREPLTGVMQIRSEQHKNPAFIFFLQSCGIIRGYTILRRLQIIPPPFKPSTCAPSHTCFLSYRIYVAGFLSETMTPGIMSI